MTEVNMLDLIEHQGWYSQKIFELKLELSDRAIVLFEFLVKFPEYHLIAPIADTLWVQETEGALCHKN
mgnify:CR=1 FL=1